MCRAEVTHRLMGYEQSSVTGYYLGVTDGESTEAADMMEESVEFHRQNEEN